MIFILRNPPTQKKICAWFKTRMCLSTLLLNWNFDPLNYLVIKFSHLLLIIKNNIFKSILTEMKTTIYLLALFATVFALFPTEYMGGYGPLIGSSVGYASFGYPFITKGYYGYPYYGVPVFAGVAFGEPAFGYMGDVAFKGNNFSIFFISFLILCLAEIKRYIIIMLIQLYLIFSIALLVIRTYQLVFYFLFRIIWN